MFTGIIQSIGEVIEISNESLTVSCKDVINELNISDSISISGTCLTIIEKNLEKSTFKVNVIPETLQRTNLGHLSNKSKVNLETSAKLGGVIGGHLVQGHIDCTSEIINIKTEQLAKFIAMISPFDDIDKQMLLETIETKAFCEKLLSILEIEIANVNKEKIFN